MGECINITNIKFDKLSMQGIKYIKERTILKNQIRGAFFGGSLLSIFGTDKVAEMTYNLTQMDFEILIKSMNSLSRMEKTLIRNEAIMQTTYHPSGEQYMFWKGIANGCTF